MKDDDLRPSIILLLAALFMLALAIKNLTEAHYGWTITDTWAGLTCLTGAWFNLPSKNQDADPEEE